MTSDPVAGATIFNNTITDQAAIQAQIGQLHGDVVFHRDATIYQVTAEDDRGRRFEVAQNHLCGGAARLAERLFVDLLSEGAAESDTAYYAALAVLDGRAVGDLGNAERTALKITAAAGSNCKPDAWTTALDLLHRIVDHATEVVAGTTGSGELDAALEEMAGLPATRYGEFTRHLSLILSGIQSERLHVDRVEFAETARFEHNRVERAWRFFEPTPAAPLRMPVRLFLPRRALAAAAVLVGSLITLVSALLLWRDGVVTTGVGVVTLVVAAFAGVVWRQAALGGFDRRSRMADFTTRPAAADIGTAPLFYLGVARLVLGRFRDHTPRPAGTWAEQTEGIRWSVVREFATTYRRLGVPAAAIGWLIRHRVDAMVATWQTPEFLDLTRAVDEVSQLGLLTRWTRPRLYLSAAVWLSIYLIVSLIGAWVAVHLAVFAGAALVTALSTGTLSAARAYRDARKQEAEERHEQEILLFKRWQGLLDGTPSDPRMGQWLDSDKVVVRAHGMRRFGLTERDVLAHLMLTEGAPGAVRTRVLHGVPRYSVYRVHQFFFTDNGVREMVVDLDMLTGAWHGERRRSFRYDALAGVSLDERESANRQRPRRIVSPALRGPGIDDSASILPDLVLSLSLVSGDVNAITVESFDGLSDDELEDTTRLRELALESSGVAEALRVLESVAGEGSEWTSRERDRRRRAALATPPRSNASVTRSGPE